MSTANNYGEYGVSDETDYFNVHGAHENTPETVFTSDVFPELGNSDPLDP